MARDDLRLHIFRKRMAEVLDEMRPDRYIVADSLADDEDGETPEDEIVTAEWLDTAASSLESLLPLEQVRKLYARELVGRAEEGANRRGNQNLRTFFEEREQLNLGWLPAAGYPITVVHRIAKPGKRVRIVRERIRIWALTDVDLRDFAAEERRNAAREFATRNKTCESAEWYADYMTERGAVTIKALLEMSAAEEEVAVHA